MVISNCRVERAPVSAEKSQPPFVASLCVIGTLHSTRNAPFLVHWSRKSSRAHRCSSLSVSLLENPTRDCDREMVLRENHEAS